MCHARYACELRGWVRARTNVRRPRRRRGWRAVCPSHREPLLLPTHRPAAHAPSRHTQRPSVPRRVCGPLPAGTTIYFHFQVTCSPASLLYLLQSCPGGRRGPRRVTNLRCKTNARDRIFCNANQAVRAVDMMMASVSLSAGDRDQHSYPAFVFLD